MATDPHHSATAAGSDSRPSFSRPPTSLACSLTHSHNTSLSLSLSLSPPPPLSLLALLSPPPSLPTFVRPSVRPSLPPSSHPLVSAEDAFGGTLVVRISVPKRRNRGFLCRVDALVLQWASHGPANGVCGVRRGPKGTAPSALAEPGAAHGRSFSRALAQTLSAAKGTAPGSMHRVGHGVRAAVIRARARCRFDRKRDSQQL